jgi:hypothetical protein
LIAFDCILIGELETMPQEEVEIAERAKEKERRTRAREIKLELAIKAQEERIQRSIRRAQEPVKRREGKPIMFRSVLQVRKKKVVVKSDYNEEDDVNFYLGMGDDCHTASLFPGTPLLRDDVVVTGGVFSVELDFAAAITSADFQLQIGVRPGAASVPSLWPGGYPSRPSAGARLYDFGASSTRATVACCTRRQFRKGRKSHNG